MMKDEGGVRKRKGSGRGMEDVVENVAEKEWRAKEDGIW